MNTKEEWINSLNEIDDLLRAEKYKEARMYIKQKKSELNLKKDDQASKYMDDLINKLK